MDKWQNRSAGKEYPWQLSTCPTRSVQLALPATAQVAKQQGQYLAKFFNNCAADDEKIQRGKARFDYAHKGSLAYIGKNAAVADIPGFAIVKGLAAGLIWKSFETLSQVSVRNVLLVMSDMIRTRIVGRDVSRIN